MLFRIEIYENAFIENRKINMNMYFSVNPIQINYKSIFTVIVQ